MDYKEAYEKEHLKNAELAGRGGRSQGNGRREDLSYKLDRIKNNPLFKASKPARNVMALGHPPEEPVLPAAEVRRASCAS